MKARHVIHVTAYVSLGLVLGLSVARWSLWDHHQRIPGDTTEASLFSGEPIEFVTQCGPYDVFLGYMDGAHVYWLVHVSESDNQFILPASSSGQYMINVGRYYHVHSTTSGLATFAAARRGNGDLGEMVQDKDGDGKFDTLVDLSGCIWSRESNSWKKKGGE